MQQLYTTFTVAVKYVHVSETVTDKMVSYQTTNKGVALLLITSDYET